MSCLAAAAAGCNNDKTDDGNPPHDKPPFVIVVDPITETSATVNVTPLSEEAPYYFDVVEADKFSGTEEFDPEAYFKTIVEQTMNINGWSLERSVESLLVKGLQQSAYDELEADTRYIAFAIGIDLLGNQTTEAVCERFRTLSEQQQPFAIETSELTDSSVKVSVTPRSETDPYCFDVVSMQTMKEFEDNPQLYLTDLIHKMAEQSGKGIAEIVESITVKGNATKTFDQLTPETEYLVFAMHITAAGTCTTGNFLQIVTPKGEGAPFTISLDGITGSTVDVTVTPASQTMSYFSDVLSKSVFDEYHAGNVATYLENFVQDKIGKGLSIEEIYPVIATTGTDTQTIKGLTPKTDYIALAIGIDEQCKPTTAAVIKEFTTEEVTSDNTYQVSFSEPEFDGIDFTVTPENDDVYFYMWKPKAHCDTLTDEQIIDELLAEYGFMIDFLYSYTGVTTYENEHVMSTDTGYYVCVFGYSDGINTTPLYKFPFRTAPSQTDPAQCSFLVETTDITSSSATVQVIPSDRQVMYMWDLIDADTYRQNNSTMNRYVTEYVAQDLPNLEYIRVRGEDGLPFNRTLTPNTEYYVWTAAIDEFGKPVGEVKMSDPFRTLPRELSSATVTADFMKYFDGDELYALSTTDYGDCRGKAYVYVNFHQNADASLWYGQMFDEDLSDPTDPTDSEIITTLVDNNGGLWCPVGKPFLCDWDKTHTILAVALGKDDNYGPVFRSTHTFTKAGAAPASEIGDVLPNDRTSARKSAQLTRREGTSVVQRFKPMTQR